MTWASVRPRLVTIVEGTTVPAKTRGKASAFKHFPTADDLEALPPTRGFILRVVGMAVLGPTPVGQAYRQRDVVELVIAYHRDTAQQDLEDAIAADFRAITQRMANPANWARSTSTIIALAESVEDLMFRSSIDDVDGARLLRITFPVIHEVT